MEKKYTTEESKKILQNYAIDIASGVGSKLGNTDILEYITCLSEDDRQIFTNLEERIRKSTILNFVEKFKNHNGVDHVSVYVRETMTSSLNEMNSEDIIKITSNVETFDHKYIANAIMESLKKSLEN